MRIATPKLSYPAVVSPRGQELLERQLSNQAA
jgi:hypothetical protein